MHRVREADRELEQIRHVRRLPKGHLRQHIQGEVPDMRPDEIAYIPSMP